MQATQTEPIPFAEFRAKLLAIYSAPLRAPTTLEAMARVTASLAGTPGLSTTADLTTETIASWIAIRSNEVRRNTVIGELGYVKSACSFAVECGFLARHPFVGRRLRLRRERVQVARHHSVEAIARVLDRLKGLKADWISHRLYALAATVAYTGVRRDEALHLACRDVLLEERVLEIVERSGSGPLKTEGSAQPVPIAPELVPILAEWIPRCGSEWLFPNQARTAPWTGGNPGTKPLDRLKQAAQAAGVEGFTFLSLRHSWATHAESAWGLSEAAIQRVLRHTSPLTQMHYRHADRANLRRIGRKVSYAATPPPPCPSVSGPSEA